MKWVLALVPAALVVSTFWFIETFAGRYELLGAAYAPLLNAGVLLRGFGMFVSVVLVWAALRNRGASRWVLALAILSGPVAYGVYAAFNMLSYFPAGQAAYYGLNPMFVAAIAAQCAAAGLAEMVWRRRSGQPRRPLTPGLITVVVAGLATVFFTVLYQGGVPFFYVYQRGYLLLFT